MSNITWLNAWEGWCVLARIKPSSAKSSIPSWRPNPESSSGDLKEPALKSLKVSDLCGTWKTIAGTRVGLITISIIITMKYCYVWYCDLHLSQCCGVGTVVLCIAKPLLVVSSQWFLFIVSLSLLMTLSLCTLMLYVWSMDDYFPCFMWW